MSNEKFIELALSFNNVNQAPHFERTSFRVGKKIFGTLHEKNKIATLRLSVGDQQQFCGINPSAIYPVPGKWGAQGWTSIELAETPYEVSFAGLEAAYTNLLHNSNRKK